MSIKIFNVHLKWKNTKSPRIYVNFQMYLIVNGKRVKKKKSSLGKSGDASNPVWNEAFTFNFSQSNLHNAALEVSCTIISVQLYFMWKMKLCHFFYYFYADLRCIIWRWIERIELWHWSVGAWYRSTTLAWHDP